MALMFTSTQIMGFTPTPTLSLSQRLNPANLAWEMDDNFALILLFLFLPVLYQDAWPGFEAVI